VHLAVNSIPKEVADAARILHKAHEDYNVPSRSTNHQEFKALKLQAAIVQFEFCSLIWQFLILDRNSFARKVILKDFIHKVYEYDKTLRKSHQKRMCELAKKRNLPALATKLEESSRTWRKPLVKIGCFKDIRNKTAGHYDQDIAKQVQLIESIEEGAFFPVFEAFLSFEKEGLEILRSIGLGLKPSKNQKSF